MRAPRTGQRPESRVPRLERFLQPIFTDVYCAYMLRILMEKDVVHQTRNEGGTLKIKI